MTRVSVEEIAPLYGGVTHPIRQHLLAKGVEIDREDYVDRDEAVKALEKGFSPAKPSEG